VDKLPTTQQGCPLRVRTKNFLSAEFTIPKERDCADLFATLNQLKAGKINQITSLINNKFNYFLKIPMKNFIVFSTKHQHISKKFGIHCY
jgi:hypothetical protein